MPQTDDPRRTIARLAVAVLAADDRIVAPELEAITRLDRFGLGPLAALAREELGRCLREPVDVEAACRGLGAIAPEATAHVFAALAEVAASDRMLAEQELEVLERVASGLGLDAEEAERILTQAVAADRGQARKPAPNSAATRDVAPPPSPVAAACRLLGFAALPRPEELEAAYLRLVERYDPAKVGPLGAEFAALAVRRLMAITAAFETVRAALEARDGGADGAPARS